MEKDKMSEEEKIKFVERWIDSGAETFIFNDIPNFSTIIQFVNSKDKTVSDKLSIEWSKRIGKQSDDMWYKKYEDFIEQHKYKNEVNNVVENMEKILPNMARIAIDGCFYPNIHNVTYGEVLEVRSNINGMSIFNLDLVSVKCSLNVFEEPNPIKILSMVTQLVEEILKQCKAYPNFVVMHRGDPCFKYQQEFELIHCLLWCDVYVYNLQKNERIEIIKDCDMFIGK